MDKYTKGDDRMTFEDKVKEMLVENGMFDNMADAVLEAVKTDEANEAMADRWQDDIEGYPEIMLGVLWASAKRHAVKWIDANRPMAWFRPLFAGQEQ